MKAERSWVVFEEVRSDFGFGVKNCSSCSTAF